MGNDDVDVDGLELDGHDGDVGVIDSLGRGLANEVSGSHYHIC